MLVVFLALAAVAMSETVTFAILTNVPANVGLTGRFFTIVVPVSSIVANGSIALFGGAAFRHRPMSYGLIYVAAHAGTYALFTASRGNPAQDVAAYVVTAAAASTTFLVLRLRFGVSTPGVR